MPNFGRTSVNESDASLHTGTVDEILSKAIRSKTESKITHNRRRVELPFHHHEIHWLLRTASVFFHYGHFQKSEHLLTALLAIEPQHQKAIKLLAITYLKQSNYQLSINTTQNHLAWLRQQQLPIDPIAYWLLSQNYYQLGNVEEAKYYVDLYVTEREGQKESTQHTSYPLGTPDE